MRQRCPVCGETPDAASNFCLSCNNQLLRCQTCGALNTKLFSFCHSCGQKLPRQRQVSPLPSRGYANQVRDQIDQKARATIDQRVYSYLVSHGGTISWSQASHELNLQDPELKASVDRLVTQGLLEPQQQTGRPSTLETTSLPEVEELKTALDPLTLTVTVLMLAAIRDAKKQDEYMKIDRLTSKISEVALDKEKPRDAAQLDFRDQLKLTTLVFEFVRDRVPYKGEPFGGLIRKPWETLETGGDCDCKAVLLATMLDNLGFRKLMLSVLPPGKYSDSRKGEDITLEGHVFVEVGLIKADKTVWIRLDPSCPDCGADELPESYTPFLPNFYRVPVHYR